MLANQPNVESPLHLLQRVQQLLTAIVERQVAALGLTAGQLRVMEEVRETGGVHQVRLVNRTGMDRSTISDIVRRLQRKGLLSSQRSRKDARTRIVMLTPAGLATLEATTGVRQLEYDVLNTAIGSERSADLLRSLQQILANKPLALRAGKPADTSEGVPAAERRSGLSDY